MRGSARFPRHVLLGVGLAFLSVLLPDVSWAQADAAAQPIRYRVELGDSPARGPADAPITIVEFSDFLCPLCRRATQTFDDLRRLFPGKLRFVFRIHPLDPEDGTLPAEAALAAREQGRFWDMHDRLFSTRQGLSREVIEGFAQEIGLDMARFRQALDSRQYLPAVRRDATAIRSLGMTSVPVFFVNGRMLSGAHPVSSFARVIREELVNAETVVASGVAPEDLYAHLIADGQAYVAPEDHDGEKPVRFDETAKYNVRLGLPGHARGPADALVTIVVFSEFECPFSARAAVPLALLEQDHPADLRVVYRHLPLRSHVRAHLAAEASVFAAQEGKFWEFHDVLYRHQGPRDRAALEWYAERLGLDMGRFRSALDDRSLLETVHGDTASAYSLGIGATPTMVINGRVVRGAIPYESLSAIVDEQLAEARALLKTGVPRAEVYEALMRDADISEVASASGEPLPGPD